MASMAVAQLLLLSFILHTIFSFAQKPFSSNTPIILSVTKDVTTLQYLTRIHLGSLPVLPLKVAVDLGGPSLWWDCSSGSLSSSRRFIPCNSLECLMAQTNPFCPMAEREKQRNPCSLVSENTVAGMSSSGYVAEDIVTVKFAGESDMGSIGTVGRLDFLFACAPTLQLKGLASGVKGMLGLGRSRISLPSQLSSALGISRKFAFCLSSSSGFVVSGGSPYESVTGADVSRSLIYTPLFSDPSGERESMDYFINVKTIRINGRQLSIDRNGAGPTKLSTVIPYTTMESTLFHTFTEAYAKAATSMNMTRVDPVSPFKYCFRSTGWLRPAVPTVDLVLQSELVKWRIQGRNSMVRVSDEVTCLGFFDGGSGQKIPIVIGSHQLEDNLMEFDMANSMFGFGEISCSDLKFHSMDSGSI